MDLFEAINHRFTAPRLIEPGPDPTALAQIIGAGVRAPDHGRLAPWRFVVIAGEARARLGDAMAELRRAAPDATEAAAEAERAKAFRAPLIIAVGAEVTRGHRVPPIEQVMAVASCVQNMTLAAHALGFAANWKTGPAAYDVGVKQALGFAASIDLVALLYIGTAAATPPPRAVTTEGLIRIL